MTARLLRALCRWRGMAPVASDMQNTYANSYTARLRGMQLQRMYQSDHLCSTTGDSPHFCHFWRG